jgi:hypothetical protein
LTVFSILSLLFMLREVSVINESQPHPQIWAIICSWALHTSGNGLYDSHA